MRSRGILAAVGLLLVPAVFAAYSAFGGTSAGTAIAVFELKMSGKSWQTGVVLNPGVKPPIGKVTNKDIAAVLKEELPDFAADYLDLDPGGRFYLFYDTKSSWRVATNSAGTNATTLHGQVANDGVFWMAGSYDFAGAGGDVFVTGKVTFKKGTFEPKKVKGKMYFVSETITTGLNLKFQTVDVAL